MRVQDFSAGRERPGITVFISKVNNMKYLMNFITEEIIVLLLIATFVIVFHNLCNPFIDAMGDPLVEINLGDTGEK